MSLVSIRQVRHAAGMLALIAGVAHRGDAQVRAWDDYCTTGSLQMCMSIGVEFAVVTPFGTPLTLVTLTLQNLEGSIGSQAWGLQGVFLSNLALDGQPITAHVFDSSSPAFEGNAQDHGVPTALLNGFWLWNTTAASTASFDRETQLGDGGYPIAGCSPLTANPGFGANHGEIGYFSTCGNGAIQYSFLMPQVEFTNATHAEHHRVRRPNVAAVFVYVRRQLCVRHARAEHLGARRSGTRGRRHVRAAAPASASLAGSWNEC